jgi:hypothetical protein
MTPDDSTSPKRGRPKVEDSVRLRHVLQLRLNEVQRNYLFVLAEEWDCSVTEAARRCIDAELDRDDRRIQGLDVDGKPATMRQALGLVRLTPEWVSEQVPTRDEDSE